MRMSDESITPAAPASTTPARKPRRRWIIVGVVLLLALYIASPYYAFYRFATALRAGDAAQLERSVDFDAVRKSMRRQLNAKITELRPQNPKRQKMFDAMTSALGPSVVDSLLDAYLTPEGLAAFIANPKLPGPPAPSSAGVGTPAPPTAPAGDTTGIAPEAKAQTQGMSRRVTWDNVHYAFFTSPRSFLVDVGGTKLRFRFTGLRWRVKDLELDVSKLKI
jgi:hypothetical protein